ncbi:phage tail protein [Pseudomonas sp. PDM20]|uniref:phage tail protein n=1 Tax=Pseudomonas sp. PDM20 TaxID=2769254 RepID=UPI0017813D5A|nr:phage tail protein [Pseudomonas sp. PDM20]MBD9685256.1 phage tail protein [Pseudomonas sp. PDM20]
MAVETFKWPIEAGGEGEVTFRLRSAQFGDGYRQTLGDGLNNRSQQWPVILVVNKDAAQQVLAFFDRHAGSRAFLWTPPLGSPGLYSCNAYKPTNIGGTVYRIAATFEQVFHP